MKLLEHRKSSVVHTTLTAPVLLATLLLLAFGVSVLAGPPEYTKLDYAVGSAYEIKGDWHKDGYLIASDIEPLPRKRRPKLRGRIQAIDAAAKTIVVYGRQIIINDKTEFIDEIAAGLFNRLKIKQRIEVSCKVRKDGSWAATKLRLKAVRNSNKIKGTLTKVMVDGNAPDTIMISGLMVILERRTDVDRPSSHLDRSEKLLFGDLARNSAWGITDGYAYNDQINLSGQYRQNLRSEGEYDLYDLTQSDRSTTQPEARVEIQTFLGNNVRGLAKLRLRQKYTVASDQTLPTSDLSTQFIELYLMARNIGGKGFGLVVGRQDFDEPREWLFDEYLDAVRGYYYGTAPLVFEIAYIHAVEPMKTKSATWTDIFAQVTWLLSDDARASLYYLTRSDTDLRNREPRWYGLRYNGRISSRFKPWLDLAIMKGTDKGKDLDAWAADLGLIVTGHELPAKPSMTFSYAIGSGDDTSLDNVNHSFRQTGYQDNVEKFGGTTSVPYYGAVLAPELSNLKITTLGVSANPYRKASVDLVYHTYNQHHPDKKLKGSDLFDPTGAPNGSSNDIGTAFDIILALPTFWKPARVAWTIGWFFPGEAFGPYQQTASINKLNLTINI